MYFDHTHPTPLSNFSQIHPYYLPPSNFVSTFFLIAHWFVLFVLMASQVIHWSTVNLPEATHSPSPRRYQLSILSQWGRELVSPSSLWEFDTRSHRCSELVSDMVLSFPEDALVLAYLWPSQSSQPLFCVVSVRADAGERDLRLNTPQTLACSRL